LIIVAAQWRTNSEAVLASVAELINAFLGGRSSGTFQLELTVKNSPGNECTHVGVPERESCARCEEEHDREFNG